MKKRCLKNPDRKRDINFLNIICIYYILSHIRHCCHGMSVQHKKMKIPWFIKVHVHGNFTINNYHGNITSSIGIRDSICIHSTPSPPPPPPPLKCIRGPHAHSHFFGKQGFFFCQVSGRFPDKNRKRGHFFVIDNGNQYSRWGGGGISFSWDRGFGWWVMSIGTPWWGGGGGFHHNVIP